MELRVHGGLLNAAGLGRALDVSSPTVARYLDALEGTFMIRRLKPHFANVSKRLVKSPKVYVRDTGLFASAGPPRFTRVARDVAAAGGPRSKAW